MFYYAYKFWYKFQYEPDLDVGIIDNIDCELGRGLVWDGNKTDDFLATTSRLGGILRRIRNGFILIRHLNFIPRGGEPSEKFEMGLYLSVI